MPRRFILLLIVASICGSIGFFATEKDGDPAAIIRDVETRLERAFDETIVYEGGQDLLDSLKKYRISIRDGRSYIVHLAKVDSNEELEEIIDAVLAAGYIDQYVPPARYVDRIVKVVQLTPGASDLRYIWGPLTWGNRNIAEAKALVRFNKKPEDILNYDWDKRYRLSQAKWNIEEPTSYMLRRAKNAGLAAITGSVGIWFTLIVLSWLWLFFLARLREIADAVRGK